MTSEKKRHSFLKLSDKDMEELLCWSPSSREKNQEICNAVKVPTPQMGTFDPSLLRGLEDYAGNAPPPRVSKVTKTSSLKRKSGFNRRSIISTKKVIQKKTVNNINSYLYRTTRESKVQQTNIPQDILSNLETESKSKNVRKELFKLPVGHSSVRPKTIRGKFFEGPNYNQKKPVDQSPLIDIDKADKMLRSKSYLKTQIKKPTTPKIIVTPPPNLSSVTEEVAETSPSTSGSTQQLNNERKYSSDLEFENMEKMYNAQNPEGWNKIIDKIRQIVQQDQKDFTKYQKAHENRMNSIMNLLTEIEEKKSIASAVASPSSNKTNDLRMNLLKSKMIKSVIGTPKEKKALNMYNSLRDTFDLLETPKFSQTRTITNRKSSGSKNMSRKLQEQCLLLLETPHK